MIEYNPSNVSSGFEMLSVGVEEDIDLFLAVSRHGTWVISDAGRQRPKEAV